MGWEPAGARRGNSGSAGSPGSRGGSSDNPRDPSPTPGTGASPSSVTPALLPRLVPGRPAAQRRLASHHRMARARLRRRPPGRAAQPQGSRARRARGRSRRCRLSAGFPSWPGLLLVPGWPAARGGSSGRAVGWRGRRAAGRGGVPGVQAPSAAAGGVPGPGGGVCAPGADRSFGSGSANPGPTSLYGTARNVIRGGTGYRAWLWGACRPGHARVCWCEDGQIAAPVWPAADTRPCDRR